MSSELRAWSLVAAAILLGACTIRRHDRGNPIAAESIARIRVGMNENELLDLVGPPLTIYKDGDKTIFYYVYAVLHGFNFRLAEPLYGQTIFEYDKQDARNDQLLVFLDRKGLVTHHSFQIGTESFKEP